MAMHLDRFAPFAPSDEDKALAAESIRRLSRHLRKPHKLTLQVKGQKGPEAELVLSAGAVKRLGTALTEIARGNSVAAVPVQAELTSQQAADLLNVSRPYLIKLLDEGKIPHRKSGSHRRVALKDVLDYKRRADESREAVLAELAVLGQELDSAD
jgi:excisionase family DNA binding protein